MKSLGQNLLLGFTSLFLYTPTVFAETLQNLGGAPGDKILDVATIYSLETLFENIVRTVVSLSAVALFIMFVIAGFSFLFSGGDAKKLEQAKGTLTNAIIGLIVIVAAYLIIRIIQVFTGVDESILEFGIPRISN